MSQYKPLLFIFSGILSWTQKMKNNKGRDSGYDIDEHCLWDLPPGLVFSFHLPCCCKPLVMLCLSARPHSQMGPQLP